jgi:hypothetical protein
MHPCQIKVGRAQTTRPSPRHNFRNTFHGATRITPAADGTRPKMVANFGTATANTTL